MPIQNWQDGELPRPSDCATKLLRGETPWGRVYSGSREELIAATLVQEGQFPGDPGRPKKTQRYHGPPKWSVDRRSPRRFDVFLHYTEAERERHEAAEAMAKATAEAKRQLQFIPAGAADFRSMACSTLASSLRASRSGPGI